MTILIRSTLKKRAPALPAIRARLSAILDAAGAGDAELSVLFVGDAAMRTLNRRFRGKDRTTDVLSFPLREGPFPSVQRRLLGDVVVSLPAAQRQARSAGVPLREEVDRLLIHGLLHLLGHDHERGEARARRMRAAERRLRKVVLP